MKRRMMSLLLTAALLLGLLPGAAFAADANKEEVTLKKSSAWDSGPEDGKATITLKVQGYESTEKLPTNVILIMDRSGSMNSGDVPCPSSAHTPVTREIPALEGAPFGVPQIHCAITGGNYDPSVNTPGSELYFRHQTEASRIGVAQYSVREFVDQVFADKADSGTQMALVEFSHSRYVGNAYTAAADVKVGLTDSKEDILSAIDTIKDRLGGDTNYSAAFQTVLEMVLPLIRTNEARKNYPTVVVFVTDGQPNMGDGETESKTLRALENGTGGQSVKVFGVGYSGSGVLAEAALKKVADEVATAENGDALDDALSGIKDAIAVYPSGTKAELVDVIGDKFELDVGNGREIVCPAGEYVLSENNTKITWKIGNITSQELTLTIPIRLKDAYKDEVFVGENEVPTNKDDATLTYTDDKGTDNVQKTEPPPTLEKPGPAGSGYTITFHSSTVPEAIDTQHVPQDQTIDVTLKTVNFTQTDFTLAGWATSAGGNKVYELGDTLTSVTGDMDLYAVWTANTPDTATVIYQANNGKGTAAVPDSEVPVGEYTVLDISDAKLSGFTPEGYAFTGWSGSDGNSYGTDNNPTLTAGQTLTLTAQWKAEVTFLPPAGETFNNDGQSVYTAPGADGFVQFPTVKDNLNPGNWFTADAEGNPTGALLGDKVAIRDGDRFVFVFDAKGEVTVTFDVGSHGSMTADTTYTGDSDKTLGQLIESNMQPEVTANPNWQFDGWYNGDVKLTDAALDQPLTGNTTYTAKYSAKVELDPNGGKFGDESTGNKTLTVPENDLIPEGETAVSKDGYVFIGWVKEDGTTYVDLNDPVTEPLKLKAQYAKLEVEKSHTASRGGTPLEENDLLRVDDVISYTVTVTNRGDMALDNVTVKDDKFGDTPTIAPSDGNTYADGTVTIDRLDKDEFVIITYTYTVTDGDRQEHPVTNTAEAKAELTDPTDPNKTIPVKGEAEHTTASVEKRYELKLLYVLDKLNEDGSLLIRPAPSELPFVLGEYYAGDTVTGEQISQRVKYTLQEYVDSTVHDLNGVEYKLNSGTYGELPELYTIQTGGNQLTAAYPLKRMTLTYRPGTNGTLSSTDGTSDSSGGYTFTIPYGGVPNKWFGQNGHNTLDLTTTPTGDYLFSHWNNDHTNKLAQPVTEDLTFTAQWTADGIPYELHIYMRGQKVDTLRLSAPLSTPDQTTASVDPNEDSILVAQQAAGRIPQGYKFGSSVMGADSYTDKVQPFTVTKGEANVIELHYVPFDLAVWHKLGGVSVFDEAQSVATLGAETTAWANTAVFQVGGVQYSGTQVQIDSESDTQSYGSTVTVPSDGHSYLVTFSYTRQGTTPDPGDGGGGGGGGGDDREDRDDRDDKVDITDELPPLASLDMDDHFAYLIGYPDGTVRPEAEVSRQEVSAIFFRLLTEDSRFMFWADSNEYSDMRAFRWSTNAISTMTNAGIVTGYPDGSFRPNAAITRAEFAAIAARFDGAVYQGADLFSDIAGHWAAQDINRAAQKGWISGYEDGTFRPDQPITRAEAATLVNNVLNRRVEAEGLHAAMRTWPDNPQGAWYYTAIQEATNSHEYQREIPAHPELWPALRPDRDWAELEKEGAKPTPPTTPTTASQQQKDAPIGETAAKTR